MLWRVGIPGSAAMENGSREGLGRGRVLCLSGGWPAFFQKVGALLLLLGLTGCAQAISPQLRKEATQNVSFRDVLKNPEQYTGKTFIWSGTILETQNTPEGTTFKVLQKPSDYWGRPEDVDWSEGRFLALVRRYLDPAIYVEGRDVTVAGKLTGKRILPLGDIDYTYPVLAVKEIHLWPMAAPAPYYYPYESYPPWSFHFFWAP